MLTDMLILMKQELALVLIIFILLVLKLGKDRTNESYLNLVNILLLINLVAGFFWNSEGILFNEMFRTGKLIALEKNILNLAMLIISMQSYEWLKTHKHVPEFYVLLFFISSDDFFLYVILLSDLDNF